MKIFYLAVLFLTTALTFSQETGTSQEVGLTEGELSVSLTGGSIYNIPIAVPPGINGIVPQISLSYNSQSGNGLAGYGWNISGVSVITRIPSTKFHDSAIDAVDFDNLDRFALDGQRLVIKSGSYGANGAIYETESFSNVKITSYGVHPSGIAYGPAYFVINYPDGSIAEYGNSATSRSNTEWAILYWQNPQGVRISYQYTTVNNNLTISNIKYGTRLTTTAINDISFVYKTRTRPEQAYVGGLSFLRNNILSEIKVKGNNVGFRNYLLAHEPTSLGYDRLVSITEKSGDNSKNFNPTVFNYETTSNEGLFSTGNPLTSSNLTNASLENMASITGDFDGDGKIDAILYPTTGPDAKKKFSLFNFNDQNSGNITGLGYNLGEFVDIFPTSWLSSDFKLMPMQGWCVIQHNTASNVTSFKNFSTGSSTTYTNQYDRLYEFPKLSYEVDCPNLPHCNSGMSSPSSPQQSENSESIDFDNGQEELLYEPSPLSETPLDPNDPRNPSCPGPINISLSPIVNFQATLTWGQTGTPVPTSWEVYYFQTGTAVPPSNNAPIGTYTVANQNSLVINPISASRTYQFFIRSICGTVKGDWVGPINIGGLIDPVPRETRYHAVPREFVSGDFNGDGLTDVIAIEKSTTYQSVVCQGNCYTYSNVTVPGGKTYFVNLDRRLTTNFVNAAGQIITTNESKFVVADVDGDGKSDLMVFDSGMVKVYTLNANNQLVSMFTKTDTAILSEKPRYLGDFNGDGKIDFVIPQENTVDRWSFFFSKGNGFEIKTTSIGVIYNIPRLIYQTGSDGWPTGTILLEEVNYIASDYNGDGKTDIIIQTNATVEGYGQIGNVSYDNTRGNPVDTRLKLLENKGFNGTTISFEGSQISSNITNIRRGALPIFLDHNSFNQNLEYALISGNSIRTFKSSKDNKIDTRLKEIVLGNGVKEIITYSPLSTNCPLPNSPCEQTFEPSAYIESYPNFDINVSHAFQVVSKLEKVSQNEYKQQKFKYYGAVTNIEGIGFLGFRGLSKTNWFNDDYSAISTISKHDVNKRGAIIETYSVLGNFNGGMMINTPSDYISRTLLNYTTELLPNKVFKIKNTSTTSSNRLDGTSKEITSTYDEYNNPLSSTTISKNGTSVEKTEINTLEYFNQPTGTSYYIGRPKKKTVDINNSSMTGEELYAYNTSHLLSKVQKKGHLTSYLTEDNLYDVFGNITKKTITAGALAPRVTNYTYDGTGRFLLTSIDIEGLTTTYTYNSSNGLLLTETLPSNSGYPLITTHEYDVWGKKKKTTDYLGKNIYFVFSKPESNTVLITTSSDDGSSSVSKYDDLDRLVISGTKNIDNTWSYIKKQYDIYDRKISVSEPYANLTGTPTQFTTSAYDDYGRLIQTVNHTGKTTNISYSGLASTVNDGVKTVTTTKNSLGNVISLTDNGGTIYYEHFANGNLKKSTFNGIETTIKQDGWGRKTELNDPSAGIFLYEYNEFGELKKENNLLKGVTTYSLDTFGKVTEKTIVGTNGDTTNSKTTYTYNPTTKLLTSARFDDLTGGFFTNYAYVYDNYKRLFTSEESGFNAYFQRAFLYDDYGRAEKELFIAVNTTDSKTSNKWIRNTYKNGYHWQILDDATNAVLWQTNTVNARGQLTTATMGNGISITNSYDQYGFPSQYKHSIGGTAPSDVMVLSTRFTAQTGNLSSRTNSMFDYKEDFIYDTLDRLTSWKETGEMLCDCNFNTNVQGFQSVGGAGLSLLNGALRVTASGQGKGAEKRVLTNALAGQKITIKGKVTVNTATAGTTLRISFYEKNPETGQMINNTTIGVPINSTFSLVTTVTTFSDIYVKFVIHNSTASAASMVYDMDDIKITLEKNETQTYDDLGRIDKNAVGIYNYSADKPFQNTSIDLTTNTKEYYQTRSTLNISYNVFKSPVDISEDGKDKLSFIYNMNNSRSTMYYGGLQPDKLSRKNRKHYSIDGTMEIKQDLALEGVEFIMYIGGDAYSAPLILKSDGTTQNYLYLHRDYQGSILAITDQAGVVQEKRLFDAWGNITRVQDGNGNNLTKLNVIDRGYTGHEHLTGVNLIHMNGRLFDPVVHRFLQPDNFVQDPFNTQNFNRYGYCLNNPTKFKDVNGEWFGVDDLIAGVIGGFVNLGVNIWQGNITGNFWDVVGKGAAAFGSGFGAGVLSLYGPPGWVAAGVLLGGTNAWLSGSDPVEGMIIGGFSGVIGGAIGSWASGAINTIVINGIKVTSPLLMGTITGAFGGALGGGLTSFSMALMSGASLSTAIDSSVSGAKMGFVTGAVTGASGAYANSKANGINPLNGEKINYPINNGGIKGSEFNVTLNEGQVITRYGSEKGSYVSPEGTTFSQRSLPPEYNTKDVQLNSYKVIKPIPNVEGAIIAPYYFQNGGGIQYRLPQTIEWYLNPNNGYLIKI